MEMWWGRRPGGSGVGQADVDHGGQRQRVLGKGHGRLVGLPPGPVGVHPPREAYRGWLHKKMGVVS